MKYSWILFDMDNTLYDFDASSKYALKKTFDDFGIAYTPENIAIYESINHQCWSAFENGEMDFLTLRNSRFELFVEAIQQDLDAKQVGDRYIHLLSTTDYKVEGATMLLDYLKPKYNLAIVTNGLKEVKRPQLAQPEIAHYFNAIIISEEVGIAKPHTGFFDHTFNAIDQPEKSNVIIVGDNLGSDIKGGRDFGIDTCWFNPKKKENTTSILPSFEVNHLHELIDVF